MYQPTNYLHYTQEEIKKPNPPLSKPLCKEMPLGFQIREGGGGGGEGAINNVVGILGIGLTPEF